MSPLQPDLKSESMEQATPRAGTVELLPQYRTSRRARDTLNHKSVRHPEKTPSERGIFAHISLLKVSCFFENNQNKKTKENKKR
jgi:hypothetical protein